MSLDVWGALGGASRQAVSKAGDPLRWLQARLRRSLIQRSPGGCRSAAAAAATAAAGVVAAARRRLAALGAPKSCGRPLARSPQALACLLGLRRRGGEDLGQVFARWVRRQLRDLRRVARGAGVRGWRLTRRWLDSEWLPRWVRRQVGSFPQLPGKFSAGSRAKIQLPPGMSRAQYMRLFGDLF